MERSVIGCPTVSFSAAVLLPSAYTEEVQDKRQLEPLLLNVQGENLGSPEEFHTPVPWKAKQRRSRVQPN